MHHSGGCGLDGDTVMAERCDTCGQELPLPTPEDEQDLVEIPNDLDNGCYCEHENHADEPDRQCGATASQGGMCMSCIFGCAP